MKLNRQDVRATNIEVTDDTLTAHLYDGRTISAPLSWYPRLVHATPQERDNWELMGGGEGIHWPDLDEDISVEMLVGGWPSAETERNFKRWLDAKLAGLPINIYEIQPTPKEGR